MKRNNMCEVPKCGRHIVPEPDDEYPQGCIMRGLCSRCYSSRAYWRRKEDDNPGAALDRVSRLKFFSNRLHWLYDHRELED